MIQTDTVHTLTSLPATDLNFTSCLQRATDNQIRLALETMRNREGKDKGRINACERELKRRNKYLDHDKNMKGARSLCYEANCRTDRIIRCKACQ